MKEYRTKEGRFPLRLVYEPKEIDDICVDALRQAKLLPAEPGPIKIDLFLERYFRVVVDYSDLGPGIMGSTVFDSRGAVTGFVIAPWIEEEGSESADRRVRSTLAHEGGHGLLHPKLFIVDQSGDLFERQKVKQEHPRNFMCRSSDVSPVAAALPKYDGQWWEWQANRAIGGLLLPKSLVTKFSSQFTENTAFGPILKESLRTEAEKEIAGVFDVNPVVARIRLQEIYPIEKTGRL